MTDTPWGPTGELVYRRTYSRTKPDGNKEAWPETVDRVAEGNLSLVYGPQEHWTESVFAEYAELASHMKQFKIIPAGRHLWASGVKGRQYLFNCHVSGWGETPSEHFHFSFMRLMEGGGVGANYSNRLLNYPPVQGPHEVHIVCDPEHKDYQKMRDAGVLSDEYVDDWDGCWEVEDSREGWADALVDLIDTYYRPAKNRNRVFDVSRVRPEGARLKTFGGYASGPLPLAVMLHKVAATLNKVSGEYLTGLDAMLIDHAIAECVVAGGNRRSARMAIMHWNDPQIAKFLVVKEETGVHWTTNISVELDEGFYTALEADDAQAILVLEQIAEGMLRNGEPGVWNSSLSNEGEPNPVIATNPCGEIALEAWENCNLGHVNLAAFVNEHGKTDIGALMRAHVLMTRFLIRATYGDVTDDYQAQVLARNRRIGVGHLGVASYLALQGVKFSEAAENENVRDLLDTLAEVVDQESADYAHALRIPAPVKSKTVAPTGTIAKMPGVTEGIHPPYAKYFLRRIRMSLIDPEQFATATSYAQQGFKVEPDSYDQSGNTMVVEIPTKDILLEQVEAIHGDKAEELVQSWEDLDLNAALSVQAMYQELWADNAVSFTVNIDPDEYQVSDVTLALTMWGDALKGTTIFPEKSFPQAPYERISKDQYEAAEAKRVEDSTDEDCAGGSCPVR